MTEEHMQKPSASTRLARIASGEQLSLDDFLNNLTKDEKTLITGIFDFRNSRDYDWEQTKAHYLVISKQNPSEGPMVQNILNHIAALRRLELQYGSMNPYFNNKLAS